VEVSADIDQALSAVSEMFSDAATAVISTRMVVQGIAKWITRMYCTSHQ
jgi:hypothetical protein